MTDLANQTELLRQPEHSSGFWRGVVVGVLASIGVAALGLFVLCCASL